MDINFLLDRLKLSEDQILSIILTGGTKYDTSGQNKDIDYFVILDKDIEFIRIVDKETKDDYLCFGINFINKLLQEDIYHINKAFILLDLCNQNNYLEYGKQVIDFDLFDNIEKIKNYYIKWLTYRFNFMLKNMMISKNLFYAYVLMYYIKNNAYTLTEEQQNIVNLVHKKQAIDDKYIDEFVEFYGLNKTFRAEYDLLNKRYLKTK